MIGTRACVEFDFVDMDLAPISVGLLPLGFVDLPVVRGFDTLRDVQPAVILGEDLDHEDCGFDLPKAQPFRVSPFNNRSISSLSSTLRCACQSRSN